jgi:hypothetical protein
MMIYLRPYLVAEGMVLHSGLLGAATLAALKGCRIHEIEVVHSLEMLLFWIDIYTPG